MDAIWKPFATVREAVGHIQVRQVDPKVEEGTTLYAGEPSSKPGSPHLEEVSPLQINDHIYEVHKPSGRPSVELVFFHGLQLDAASSGEAHINTWTSRNKVECWLMWLLDDLPDARILTVSYDGGARTTGSHGRMDMYVTSENLIHALTGNAARVGQDGCPVVLVGHCLGGLVMKELCCQAQDMIRLGNYSIAVKTFLDNIRGLFFFATPHHGSLLADSNKGVLNAPLIKGLRTLKAQTERRNEEFRLLRKAKGWKTYGVVGLLPVTMKLFEGVVVPEASARSDMDYFYAALVDHYNICRPVNKKSTTFQLLSDFARRFMIEWQEASNEYVQIDIPSNYPECSPQALLALMTVKLTVQVVHALVAMASFAVAFTAFFNSIDSFDNLDFDDASKKASETFKAFAGGIMLGFLTLMSLLVTPMACVFLVRFCITGRWASFQELQAELAPGYGPVLDMCTLGFRSCYGRVADMCILGFRSCYGRVPDMCIDIFRSCYGRVSDMCILGFRWTPLSSQQVDSELPSHSNLEAEVERVQL